MSFVVTSADGGSISVKADSADAAYQDRREQHVDGIARRIEARFGLRLSGEERRWLRATILAAIDGRPEGVSEAVGAGAGVEELYA